MGASFKEFIANPPEVDGGEEEWTKKKTKQAEEDDRIMGILDASIAKDKAKADAKLHLNKETEVAGIAQEWAIKESALRTLRGELDKSVTEQEFTASSKEEALTEAEKTYARIKSPEYIKAQEEAEKSGFADNGNQLFFPGMSDLDRKKREIIVEKVKKQYQDMLSEEEMEQIISELLSKETLNLSQIIKILGPHPFPLKESVKKYLGELEERLEEDAAKEAEKEAAKAAEPEEMVDPAAEAAVEEEKPEKKE